MKDKPLSQLSNTEKLELIRHLQAQVQAFETIYPSPSRLNLQSEDVVDEVIKHLPILIFTVDADGHIIEMQGQTITHVIHADAIADAIGKSVHTVFKQMPAIPYDMGRALNGQSVQNTIELNAAIFRAFYQPIQHDGEITGAVVVFTDLQAMVEREKTYLDSETRLRAVFEQTQQFMCLLKTDGTIIEVNRVALEFAGLRRNDALGKQLAKMTWWQNANAKQQLKLAIAECLKGEIVKYETVMSGQGKQTTTIDLTLKPILNPQQETTMILAEGHNISERKFAEEQVRTTLERERELSDLKSSFITFTSHEFRNPLAVIASSTYLLRKHGNKFEDDVREKHFNKIETNVDYIATMLDDILLLGQLRANQVRHQVAAYPVSRLMAELMGDYERRYGQSHTFTLESNPPDIILHADQTLMEQAINQVLKNAVIYSGKQGNIQMCLSLEDDEFMIRISDDGVGILADEISRIFDSFVRGSNADNFPGTGLGLAIVKDIIDLHHGSIQVRSEPGKTDFTITIPQPAK